MKRVTKWLSQNSKVAQMDVKEVFPLVLQAASKGEVTLPQIFNVAYIPSLSNLTQVVVGEGKKAIQEILGNKADMSVYTPNNKLMFNYAVLMGYLTTGVVVCVKETDEDKNYVLGTRCEPLLEALYKANALVDKDGKVLDKESLDKAISSIKAGATKKGAETGTTTMLKLEVNTGDVDGKTTFKLTKTQSCLDLSTYSIYSWALMNAWGESLGESLAKTPMVYFEKNTKVGVKKHVITQSKEVIANLYKECDVKDATDKIKSRFELTLGYDPLTLRIRGVNVEGSAYAERGDASFRLYRLKAIRPAKKEDLDLTVVNVDLKYLRSAFDKKVREANKAELKALTSYLTLEQGKKYRVSEIKEMLYLWSAEQDAATLYKIVKTIGASTDVNASKAFGNVDKVMTNFERIQPKATKEFETFTFDDNATAADKVAQLKSLAKTKVLKIKYRKKDGTEGVVRGTNCTELLAKVWGRRSYIALFETPVVRLKAAAQDIAAGVDVGTAFSRYNVENYVKETGVLDSTDLTNTAIPAINAAVKALETVNEERPLKENMFRLRRLPVDNEKTRAISANNSLKVKPDSIYRTLNVDNIISVEVSKFGEKEKK